MTEKPNLYIIMGPNGAGKSTYGSFLLDNYRKTDESLLIYDSDLRYQILYSLLYDTLPKDCNKEKLVSNFEDRELFKTFYCALGFSYVKFMNIKMQQYFEPTLEWYFRKYSFIPNDLYFHERDNFIKEFRRVEFEIFYQDKLEKREDFAFETPFSYWGKEILLPFKEKGYCIIGFYFGLNNMYESLSRVYNREQINGHKIPISHIIDNYEKSSLRIKENLSLFDEVNWVDTNDCDSDPNIFCVYTKQKNVINHTLPLWFLNMQLSDMK